MLTRLDAEAEELSTEVLQGPGEEPPLPTRVRSHVRPVGGGVPRVRSRMAEHEHVQVVLESMSHEYLALEEGCHLTLAVGERDSLPIPQVALPNARILCSEVRHERLWTHVFVVDDFPVKVDETAPCES